MAGPSECTAGIPKVHTLLSQGRGGQGHRRRRTQLEYLHLSGSAAPALALSAQGCGRGGTLVTMVGEGGHELRLAGQGLLLEVGALQAVTSRRPFLRVVHEEEVHQAQASL